MLKFKEMKIHDEPEEKPTNPLGITVAIASWLPGEFVLTPTAAENVVPDAIVPSGGWYE